jgi:glycosyltransferase involved in cell wall biosynthesis
MKISFVIPAYNEELSIARCLESVERELSSGEYDAEVIVVNNASTDRTHEIASSFDWVKVVDEREKGLVRARHAGFSASTGELIANIDADTILPAGWLSRVMNEFEKSEKLVALSGPFIYYDLPFYSRLLTKFFYAFGYLTHLFNHFILRVGAMLQGGNFIVRRAALEKIGGYDTSIAFYGEDTDVARRLSSVGRVKWTFGLPIYASGRRLKHEGIVTMGVRYSLNYLSVIFFGKPFTVEYIDIREKL